MQPSAQALLAAQKMRLQVMRLTASLGTDERWKQLVEGLLPTQRNAAKALVGSELSPYWQGFYQGYWQAISTFTTQTGKTEQDAQALELQIKNAETDDVMKDAIQSESQLSDEKLAELLRDAGIDFQPQRTR